MKALLTGLFNLAILMPVVTASAVSGELTPQEIYRDAQVVLCQLDAGCYDLETGESVIEPDGEYAEGYSVILPLDKYSPAQVEAARPILEQKYRDLVLGD